MSLNEKEKKRLESARELMGSAIRSLLALRPEGIAWAKKNGWTAENTGYVALLMENEAMGFGPTIVGLKLTDDLIVMSFLNAERLHYKILLAEAEQEIAFLKGQGEKDE